MFDSIYTILPLALGLGMLHALDADHVLTVTGISANNNQWHRLLKYSSHWALGHSFSLLFIGLCVFLLGLSFNSAFSEYAELIVATILALIGIRILIESARQILGFKPDLKKQSKLSTSRAIVVGSVHGVAGTASVLALIPVSKMTEPLLALSYLMFFSIGVIFSMFIFGSVFRHTVTRIILRYPHATTVMQMLIGLFAIAFSVKLVLPILE